MKFRRFLVPSFECFSQKVTPLAIAARIVRHHPSAVALLVFVGHRGVLISMPPHTQ